MDVFHLKKFLFMGQFLIACFMAAILACTSASAAVKPCSDTPDAADCSVQRINTRGWEDSPYLTPDGKHLYFMYNPYNYFEMFFGGEIKKLGPDRPEFSTRDSANPWSPSNTYVTNLQSDGKWSQPRRVEWDRPDGSCCAMGNTALNGFYYQAGNKADEGNREIVFSYRKPDGSWSEPVYFGATINTSATEDNPHISYDLRTLYWTSTRGDGLGGKDIWVSHYSEGQGWLPAKNMGPMINSEKDEDQLWLSQDGRTAYFNRETTIMTSQYDGKEWSLAKPVAFETPVMAAEASLTLDGKTMALAVVDVLRRDIVISLSRLKANGIWSTPIPID